MNKERKILAISIGLCCFVLVAVMTMQFKVVNITDITSIENMRESELRTELATWKEKYEEVNDKYEETAQTITQYEQESSSDTKTSELLANELEQINLSLGKTDVEGEGITITLKDSTENYIKAENLLLIVNALKLAGAEAISINEQRIINMTDIVDINNSFIKVNGQRILSPYVIKAIGNQTYLESGLLGNGGYIDRLQKEEQDVRLEKDKKVKILKYEKEIDTKYIE